MYTMRKLATEEFVKFGDIVANSYPDFQVQTKEEREKFVENSIKYQEESPTIKFYGAFNEKDDMVGVMRLHNFRMNLLSTMVDAGGVGLVAVDLLHKKEKVAFEMIKYYIYHCREKGAPIAMLYPFRPDFYKKMGFGFGTSMNQFRVKPSSLPKFNSKEHMEFITEKDAVLMAECYQRYMHRTNGLIERSERVFLFMLSNPKLRVVGFKKDGKISGYVTFTYKPNNKDNFVANDIVVNELIYENTEALEEIMTFLNSQNDQIRNVEFNVHDENFRFILDDPRNDSDKIFADLYHQSSIQGTGIMYRVVNIKKFFEDLKEHNFSNQTCRIKLNIEDSSIPENNENIVVNFKNGSATVSSTDEFDVEIAMNIADFSSMAVCTVNFKSLYKYRRVTISNTDYIDIVNKIFASADRPVCMTLF